MSANASTKRVAVIGAGPAGLMAAETVSAAGVQVDVYDAMPSVGRKFLLAGIGGMNITHAEPFETFVTRYAARMPQLLPALTAFGAVHLREWVHGLGIETFVGSSGRVFPAQMKAAPLLRAWLHRLRAAGVRIHVRQRWLGWDADGALHFATPAGEHSVRTDATVLALGGGSWARLGSDGAWVPWLRARGVDVAPLLPANCGFEVAWSEHFRDRYGGQPLKHIAIRFTDVTDSERQCSGECVVTAYGLEGGLIYTCSSALRECITARGAARVSLDLLPDRTQARIQADLSRPRGSRSFSNHLRRAGLDGVKAGLLREYASSDVLHSAERTAALCKSLPVTLTAARPLDEAISSAGGVRFEALDEHLMLRDLPGVFCAGEMLDWEAPTGGYLLTACFASGRAAGAGVLDWFGAERE